MATLQKKGTNREKLLARLDIDSASVLVNIIKGGNTKGAAYKHALEQLNTHAPRTVEKLKMQGFL